MFAPVETTSIIAKCSEMRVPEKMKNTIENECSKKITRPHEELRNITFYMSAAGAFSNLLKFATRIKLSNCYYSKRLSETKRGTAEHYFLCVCDEGVFELAEIRYADKDK